MKTFLSNKNLLTEDLQLKIHPGGHVLRTFLKIHGSRLDFNPRTLGWQARYSETTDADYIHNLLYKIISTSSNPIIFTCPRILTFIEDPAPETRFKIKIISIILK